MSCTSEITDSSETTDVCGMSPSRPKQRRIIISDSSSEITEITDPSDETNSICDQLPTHPIHKGIWFDPAEFVWAIGDKGRKMLIAGFLTLKYFPSEIATVFHRGPYHAKLSAQFGEVFVCNAHDVVNAYLYMAKQGNVEWQQKFSEERREVWESDYEMRVELQDWVDELRKSTYSPMMRDLFETLQHILAKEGSKTLQHRHLPQKGTYHQTYTDRNAGVTHRHGPRAWLRY